MATASAEADAKEEETVDAASMMTWFAARFALVAGKSMSFERQSSACSY